MFFRPFPFCASVPVASLVPVVRKSAVVCSVWLSVEYSWSLYWLSRIRYPLSPYKMVEYLKDKLIRIILLIFYNFLCIAKLILRKFQFTIKSSDAVMKTLELRVETILVSQASAVNKSLALSLGLVEAPSVNVMLAWSRIGLYETPIWQASSRGCHSLDVLDYVRWFCDARLDPQRDQSDFEHSKDHQDPPFAVQHRSSFAVHKTNRKNETN